MSAPALGSRFVLFTATVMLWASAADAEIRYIVTNIGVLTGTPGNTRADRAQGINNLGQVVGSSHGSAPVGEYNAGKPFVYYFDSGALINLGDHNGVFTYAGVLATAYDINDLGQAAGSSGGHPFIWFDENQNRASDPGEVREIGYTPGATYATATAINNVGQVVGNVTSGTTAAWRWTDLNGDHHATADELLVINNGAANGINDAGTVVGRTSSGAFRWTDLNTNNQVDAGETAIVPLNILGGTNSTFTSINNVGQAAGWARNSSGGDFGIVWTDANGDNVAQSAELATIEFPDGLGNHVYCNAINDRGAAVGGYAISSRFAFIWTPQEGSKNLNDLIDPGLGVNLSQAQGINNAGQIAVYGKLSTTGSTEYAFLLTPLVKPDFDQNGHVDDTDLGTFLVCQTGPNLGPPTADCTKADFDHDSDVDVTDFAVFQRCWTGPVRPSTEGCEQ